MHESGAASDITKCSSVQLQANILQGSLQKVLYAREQVRLPSVKSASAQPCFAPIIAIWTTSSSVMYALLPGVGG